MCNFTCAINKRGGVSAQNPRIQGRNCQALETGSKESKGQAPNRCVWTGCNGLPRGGGGLGTGCNGRRGRSPKRGGWGTGSRGEGDRLQGEEVGCVGGRWAPAGPGLRAQGSFGEDRAFALCARGGWIASNACSGPVPLPLSSRGRFWLSPISVIGIGGRFLGVGFLGFWFWKGVL